ncbi:proline-rich extensin-like protein EPR1 [Durio zibethinus]|uniref:Proline-rich extensin-like protein EPR1 n=1 Tax=Durio zibethinus TaxID=66656 RepID=A0A6P6BEY0_DURZI|nr:proline-rich extensin-like protein EPR1 [Durio zibethinus]
MANTVNKALTSSFYLFFSIIVSFFVLTKQDNPCPYPCYPPPTGTGGGGVTQTPPVSSYPPPSQTGLYPPPVTSYPTPTGNLPYYVPPPPYGNSLYGQPPPDAVLPYFPYYYRKPPHETDDQSSATKGSPGKSLITMIATTNLLVFIFLVVCSLWNY